MTLFAAAIRLVGLSQREAAELFDVRLDTVKSWSVGRNRPPQGVWEDLRDLYALQVRAVEETLDMIDETDDGELALNTSGPRSTNWPTEGVHRAVLAAVALSVGLPIAREDH